MKKKIFVTLGVLIIFTLLGVGAVVYVGSHRIGQERDGTYPEYYVRDTAAFHKSLIACEHISLNAVFLNPSFLFLKTSLRSECIQNLAIATKNTQLCTKVKPVLFNSGFNEETCQAHILNPSLN